VQNVARDVISETQNKGIKFDEFLFCANSYETLKYKFCDTILLDFSKFYLMVTFWYCRH